MSLITFQLTGVTSTRQGTHSTLKGYFALACSLFCDSMTGPRQDELIAKHRLTTGDMMLLINFFAFPLCLLLSMAFEGWTPFVFMKNNWANLMPIVVGHAACGTIGQIFILRVLQSMGSLHLTLVTTSRKFFTILFSVMIFRHPLTVPQWLSIALICSSGVMKYVSSRFRVQKQKI